MTTARPEALILDDGELQDVRDTLGQLGALYSTEGDEAALIEVPLLITSLNRARQLREKGSPLPKHTLHLVVANANAQDLSGTLGDTPCDFIVRRPVDAAVLALITRRAGYQGPERRRMLRFAMGAPVSFTLEGCRGSEDAILAQISAAGCGLITRDPVPQVGIHVEVPLEVTQGRSLILAGRALRSREVPSADGLVYDTSIVFGELPLCDRVTLRAIMAGQPIDFRPSDVDPKSQKEAEANLSGERRAAARHAFLQRTLGSVGTRALTRVLVGRDISESGMRVAREPDLQLGDAVHLALYATHREDPILVDATVARDDGEQGWFLGFTTPVAGTRIQLNALLDDLADETDGDEPLWVVSEVEEA